MYEYCTKENDNNSDNSLRKHVRFNTPSKTNPQLADLNLPKPFMYNADILKPRMRPLHSIENTQSTCDQPNAPISNMTLSRLNKNGLPKPCQELELSIFDSQALRENVKFINRNNSSNNEKPCSILPEKIHFPNASIRKQNKSPNSGRPTISQPSKSDSDENLDFFTLPNSNSNILTKDTLYSVPKMALNFQQCEKPVMTYHENVSHQHRKNSLNQNPRTHNKPSQNTVCGTNTNKCNCRNNTKPETKQIDICSADAKRNAILQREHMLNQPYVEDNNVSHCYDEEISNQHQPSVSDLYDLIQMQIGHLQRLQNRVDELSKLKHCNDTTHIKYSEDERIKYSEGELYTNHRTLSPVDPAPIAQEEEIHKISIGVMTSFEVTVKSNKINLQVPVDEGVQTSLNFLNGMKSNDRENIKHCENGIQTMNFLDGIERCTKKVGLGEDFKFRNPTTSTNVTIDDPVTPRIQRNPRNIDLSCIENHLSPVTEDYNYSEDECSQPEIGWTFYNNVMNHVNRILRSPPDNIRNPPKPKIPVAELNQMCFNGKDINASSSKKVTFDFGNALPVQKNNFLSEASSDTSLHMNKLAAKYLGASSQSSQKYTRPVAKVQRNYLGDITNEMSFATMQYMQRHHLLPVPNDDRSHPNRFETEPKDALIENTKQMYKGHNKILDITALKQQPKLL
ncbi:uncharacterized protein LOC143909946 [Arctopsyche grandis]|uniref:uncharacterized protein LOC143909946 n=1 Tax=Arctopsyche grandis TaxID=121162 RepID=UPI00406D8FA3